MIKSTKLLAEAEQIKAFGSASNFIKFAKTFVKHLEKRQYTIFYGQHVIFCNSYVKCINKEIEIFNSVDGLLKFMLANKVITKTKYINLIYNTIDKND